MVVSSSCDTIPYNVPFAIMRGYLPKSCILCAIWELILGVTSGHRKTHSWQADVVRSTSHLLYVPWIGFESLHKQWLLLLAVHHPICHTTKPVPPSGILGRKWHNDIHELQTYAMGCASHLSCASKDGLETLHKQWMSPLVAYHPICHTERVPKALVFCVQFTIWDSVLVEIMALCDL